MKKLLSMLLVLTVMSTMLTAAMVGVSADWIENVEPASAGVTTLRWNDAEYLTADLTKGSKGVSADWSDGYNGSSLWLPSASLTDSTLSKDTTALSGDTVFKAVTDLVQINDRPEFDTHEDIVSYSYKMMLPSTDANAADITNVVYKTTVPLQLFVDDGVTEFKNASKPKNYGITMTAQYDDAGDLVLNVAMNNSTNIVKKECVLETDKFFDVDINWYVVEGEYPMASVFVNDELIFNANSSQTYTTGDASYEEEVTDEETGETTTVTVPAKYTLACDLVKFTAQEDVDGTLTDKLLTFYLNEFGFRTFDATVLPLTTAENLATETKEAAAGASVSLTAKSGLLQKTYVDSSSSSVETATYTLDTTSFTDDTVINLNQSGDGLTRVLSNIRVPLVDLVNADTPSYIASSFDILVPAAAAANEFNYSFSGCTPVRNEGATDDTTFKSPDFSTEAQYKDGNINFDFTIAGSAIEDGYEFVKYAERSETVSFAADTMHNIKVVYEVTGTQEAGYDIVVYGLIDDVIRYTNAFTTCHGEFGLTQSTLDITNSTGAAVDYKLDSLNLVWYGDEYQLPEKTSWDIAADTLFPLELTKVDNTVTANALLLNGSGSAAKMLVAFYGANGQLITPLEIIDVILTEAGETTITSGSVEIPENAAKAKAFLFETLTSTKPLTDHASIELAAE